MIGHVLPRLLLDAVICTVVPAPLPRTVLVGTMQGRQDVSDGDDEAIVNGFTIPGESETHVLQALEAIPGTLIGIALVYAEGMRRGTQTLHL